LSNINVWFRQGDLLADIQSQITCLSDEEIEQMFEVEPNKEKLKCLEEERAKVLSELSNLETEFTNGIHTFSAGA